MRFSPRKKLVILVSGKGTNLDAIVHYLGKQNLSADIVGVISDRPDAYALSRAETYGLPCYVIDYATYAHPRNFQEDLSNRLQTLSPDLIVLAGFMRILSTEIVEHFYGKLINIHPSLLPKFRGLKTHERVLASGELQHGTTVHFVTPELDEGPIIAQCRLNLMPGETTESLKLRVQALEHQLYPVVIAWYVQERLKLTAQGVVFDDSLLSPQGYQYVPICYETEL